jgi:hypothetical protein
LAPVLAGQYGPEGLELPDSRPARTTPVTVRRPDGQLAALFLNKEKSTPGSNPVLTDDYGNLLFFADPGEYDLTIRSLTLRVLVPVHPLDPGFGVGGEGTGGFIHNQITPSMAFQIHHQLPWHPAGVLSIESTGDQMDPKAIRFPLPGVLELEFGVPFAGTVYLS